MNRLALFFFTTLASAGAMAGVVVPEPIPIPEPGMIGLFATAGVALFLLKKFKK
ncbi:PEP-CTERM sorting domain-containing protein [Marinobacter caseinilyticus]|uniref:PEP-CTERM sorting domain-containing protein n=1 Tax=Marinobacter caseinilyticus TaxID=2692195 RepID=UPI00140C5C12|nr:PEP-CTERM sorting domain-containing protein [Marinobacter caseinilyticus]